MWTPSPLVTSSRLVNDLPTLPFLVLFPCGKHVYVVPKTLISSNAVLLAAGADGVPAEQRDHGAQQPVLGHGAPQARARRRVSSLLRSVYQSLLYNSMC